MATENPKPPEGAETFEAGSDDDEQDVETIELSAGETLQGTVVDLHEGESNFGPWFRLRINSEDHGVVDYFAEDSVKTACKRGVLTVGDDVWIAKMADERTITNDDGDDRTYNPVELSFL